MTRIDTAIAALFALVAVAGLAFTAGTASADHHEKKKSETDKPSIVEIAAQNKDFTVLVKALKAADLVPALQAEGKMFTVFAPTDEAFKKLPAGTLETLLKPENKEQLRSILLYHVVSGKMPAGAVVEKDTIKTLQGQALDVQVKDQTVMIDKAKVTKADIMASNGVIHVLDSVVLPASE